MIAAGSLMLYNSYDPKSKERLGSDPIAIFEKIMEEKYPPWKSTYELVLTGDIDGVDCVFPNLIYHFNEN